MLSIEDWPDLGEVNQAFELIFLRRCGRKAGIKVTAMNACKVLIGLGYLLEHFEDWMTFYAEVTTQMMVDTQVDAAQKIVTALEDFRESNGKPSRVYRLPARIEEDQVYALLLPS
ncbi:hypothetical protein FANTH_9380 [Fusarium anthophilum]|uniref:Uncharacterized protein n=1 Tax=Fusarium anthophilum TaxID=48485 RepID=A0A8H5DYS1_9HYPO|nr:hypothetical protein FANTH_9380 [Fusarium anthophilum]